jgi:uncharacterized protein YjbJ (UPF0337 family)
MSDKNTSTLKSYVDSATGAVQSAIGSLTGTTGDQVKGDAKQQKAEAEYDASHATAKLPGFSASSSGAVTKDDPDRSAGAWNQTIGSTKEAVGGLVGSEVSSPSLSLPVCPYWQANSNILLIGPEANWPPAEPRGPAAGGQGTGQ